VGDMRNAYNILTGNECLINGYWKKINKCLILIIEATCEDIDVPMHDVKAY
jgi:hypothetical protein